ncbi:MAG: LemA family protein [bacterium]
MSASDLSIGAIVGAGAGALLVVAAAVAIVIYNGLVRLANACERAWSNIDVLLKQRYDEIPNLVAVCRGYIEHERDLLTRVTEARAAGLAALESARGRLEADRAGVRAAAAMTDLLALAEQYPTLKANEQFLKLQTRITALENEIADRREHFNSCVTHYNVRLEQIPDVFVARTLRLPRRALLRVPSAERRVPSAGVAAAA